MNVLKCASCFLLALSLVFTLEIEESQYKCVSCNRISYLSDKVSSKLSCGFLCGIKRENCVGFVYKEHEGQCSLLKNHANSTIQETQCIEGNFLKDMETKFATSDPLLTPILRSDLMAIPANAFLTDVWAVCATEDGGAIIVDEAAGVYSVIRVQSSGVADPTLIFSATSMTFFVKCTADEATFTENDGHITTVNVVTASIKSRTLVSTPSLRGALHLEGTTYLCVDKVSGKAFIFDTSTSSKQDVITGLTDPRAVAKFSNCTHVMYFIADTSTHYIRVYSDTWELINTIGLGFGSSNGYMHWPYDVIISPKNTLWVTDSNNYRVEEFSLEGDHLGHILIGSDGIVRSYTISVNSKLPAYVWITYGTGSIHKAKKFQIY